MLLKKLKKVQQRIKTVQDAPHFHLDSQEQDIALQAKIQLQACSHEIQFDGQQKQNPLKRDNQWENDLKISDQTFYTQREKRTGRSYRHKNQNNFIQSNKKSIRQQKKLFQVHRLHSPKKNSHNSVSCFQPSSHNYFTTTQHLYTSRYMTKTQLKDKKLKFQPSPRTCCNNPEKYFSKERFRPKTSKIQKQLIIQLNQMEQKFSTRNTYSFNDTIKGNSVSLVDKINQEQGKSQRISTDHNSRFNIRRETRISLRPQFLKLIQKIKLKQQAKSKRKMKLLNIANKFV